MASACHDPFEVELRALRKENAELEALFAKVHQRWIALQEEVAEEFLRACLQTPLEVQAKLEADYKELRHRYRVELQLRQDDLRWSLLRRQKRLQRLLLSHDREIVRLRERNSELHLKVQRNERALQHSEGLSLRIYQQQQGDLQDRQMMQRLVEREESRQQQTQMAVHRLQRCLEDLNAADPFPAIPYNMVKEIVQRRREALEVDRQVQDLTLKVEALQEWLRQSQWQFLSQRCAAAWDAVVHREDARSDESPLEHEAAMLRRLIAEWTIRLQRLESRPPGSPLRSPEEVWRAPSGGHTPPVPRLHLFSGRLKAAPLSTRCSPRAAVQADSPLAPHLPQTSRSPTIVTAQTRDLLRYSSPSSRPLLPTKLFPSPRPPRPPQQPTAPRPIASHVRGGRCRESDGAPVLHS